MNLNQVIEFILKNEFEFQNENGFIDYSYIQDRFNLSADQLRIVKIGLD